MKVPDPKLSFLERTYVYETLRGLGVTLGHVIRNTFKQNEMPTVQYPEEPIEIPVRHRSRHRLTVRDNGAPKCVACMCCETVCPARCIHIVAEESDQPWIEKRPKVFEIDLLRCVFCGFCVEACPEDAIRMDTHEMNADGEPDDKAVVVVAERREDFIVGLDLLMWGKGRAHKENRPVEGAAPSVGQPMTPPKTVEEDAGWEAGAPKTRTKLPAGWRTNSRGETS